MRFLGGELNAEAMAAVVDPQLYRNRAGAAGSKTEVAGRATSTDEGGA
jgi:hypothetical protein